MEPNLPADHPNTHHYEPPWFSDSRAGIRKARKETEQGHICLKDMNVQALLDDEGFIHWQTSRLSGYRFIQVSLFRRRELDEHELDEPYHLWPARKFKRLRRTRRRGLSYESRVSPMLFRKGIRVCKRYNVIPCCELKSPAFSNPYRAARMIATVKSLNWHAFYMALFGMKYCLAKGRAVISSTGKFVILAHGEPLPPNLKHNVNYTEIWGRFS